MKNSEEKNQRDEDKNGVLSQNLGKTNERKHVELTEEQRQQRALETGMLFELKEGLIKSRAEREKQKKQVLVELHGTTGLSYEKLTSLVSKLNV